MGNPIITYLEIIAMLERKCPEFWVCEEELRKCIREKREKGILIQVYECYAEFKRCVKRKCGIWL